MIDKLNVFSENTYVAAEEWNANFKVLNRSNEDCLNAITDANEQLAFPDGDLSGVFSAVQSRPNSQKIDGHDVYIDPEQEYYKTLDSSETLKIYIESGLNAESRIVIYVPNNRTLKPIDVSYSGTLIEKYGAGTVFKAGYYYIMIYETNGTAFVKSVFTGE